MKVSVDISMYPLTEAFEARIISLIQELKKALLLLKKIL
jgi:hypothetical protein